MVSNLEVFLNFSSIAEVRLRFASAGCAAFILGDDRVGTVAGFLDACGVYSIVK